jgi:hypothetical protein
MKASADAFVPSASALNISDSLSEIHASPKSYLMEFGTAESEIMQSWI